MEIPKSSQSKVAFIGKKEIVKGIWSLYFTKPSSCSFLPGQYLDITLDVAKNRQETYSFTISSSPAEDTLAVTTRESNTEFKQSLFALTKGQKVAIRGPLGLFVVDNENMSPKVFLAGGMGITPFRSILVSGNLHLKNPITLLASFPTQKHILFKEEMEHVVKKNPHIRVVYTLTQNQDSLWSSYSGRISKKLIQEVVPSFANAEYFIAGRGEMVDDMVSLLRSMGIENKKIKTDIFTGL